jgi:hypothetical protein
VKYTGTLHNATLGQDSAVQGDVGDSGGSGLMSMYLSNAQAVKGGGEEFGHVSLDSHNHLKGDLGWITFDLLKQPGSGATS